MDLMKIVHFLWKAFVVVLWTGVFWLLSAIALWILNQLLTYLGIQISFLLFFVTPLPAFVLSVWLAVIGKLPGAQIQASGVNSSLISQHTGVFIARRFVAQGEHIAYYQDVQRVVIRCSNLDNTSPPVLDLYTKNGLALSIEQSKFGSNARKAHKIKAAQEAKMRKVSEKILKRLPHLQPGQIEGSVPKPLTYQMHIERKHNGVS
jgi:hypothetical protein